MLNDGTNENGGVGGDKKLDLDKMFMLATNAMVANALSHLKDVLGQGKMIHKIMNPDAISVSATIDDYIADIDAMLAKVKGEVK